VEAGKSTRNATARVARFGLELHHLGHHLMALLLGMQNTYFTLDFDDEV
jgi:hypothetical protein